MRPASRKEQRCLDALLQLIAEGVEFPDAVWKASNNGLAIDAARLGELYDAEQKRQPTIDECVRAVTACDSFDDIKNTEPSYAPSFYPSRAYSAAEVRMMERVCDAFNAWAAREGRERRAQVHKIQAAGEQRRGPMRSDARTGWPPGMLQDDSRQLSLWFAEQPGARAQVDKVCAEIAEAKGPRRIALVSCCGEKLSRMAPARQLYRSQLFQKSVRWVEQQGLEWFVLSAKYGLIKPDDVLMPYDYSARQMTVAERVKWNRDVAEQLDAMTLDDEGVEIVLLAGEAYAGWEQLIGAFATVEQPLRGMQIGERLSWLTKEVS